ncbi:MAG: hypothetical protein B7Z73_19930, partial [Planctomycetia bacterium 21-64-5]
MFRATIPLGIVVDNLPPAKNFIDELVFKKLKTLGVPPSAVCDDATFIRRVSIDLSGRLPAPDETAAFVADQDPAKRHKLVDRLLDSPSYADYFANKWGAILRNKRRTPNYMRGSYAFHGWIRDSLYENKPYDQFVREIVAASGELGDNPPVVWYREVKEIDQQVEDTAQLFLGLRIQCARCHHHPFEKWSQRDYYGMAAFFSQVGRKPGYEPDEQRIFHRRGEAAATNPKTGERLLPTGHRTDIAAGVTVSCVDVAVPMVIARAEHLPARGRSEPVQRERQAELFALLPEAADGRSVARRDRLGDGFEHVVFGLAGGNARHRVARQRGEQLLFDRVRPSGRIERLRVRAVAGGQPGPEPALAELVGDSGQTIRWARPRCPIRARPETTTRREGALALPGRVFASAGGRRDVGGLGPHQQSGEQA